MQIIIDKIKNEIYIEEHIKYYTQTYKYYKGYCHIDLANNKVRFVKNNKDSLFNMDWIFEGYEQIFRIKEMSFHSWDGSNYSVTFRFISCI